MTNSDFYDYSDKRGNKMKKNIFTAFFAVCALFLVSSCSEPDDDNSALMMQVVQQSQGSNSVSKNTKIISGILKKDGSKYELEITTDYVSGNGTLSLRLTSEDKSVLQLLTINKSSTDHSLIFTHKDSKKTFTDASYTEVGFKADAVSANLENLKIVKPEEDVHSFIVKGKIPSATIDKIKNCTTLEFILNDNKEVSPQISISFEETILTNIQKFM